jgi:hypothetical protein
MVKLNQLAALCISCLLPSVIVALYLTYHGGWSNFWNDYILQNINYAGHDVFHSGRVQSLSDKFGHMPMWIWQTGDIILFCRLQIFFCGSILVMGIVSRKLTISLTNLFYSFLILGMSLVSTITPGTNFQHYVILLIVPLSLFTGVFIGELFMYQEQSLSIESGRIKRNSIILLFAVCMLYVSNYEMSRMGVLLSSRKMGNSVSPISKLIGKYAKPNEPMSIWGWACHYYVETGLYKPIRRAIHFIY